MLTCKALPAHCIGRFHVPNSLLHNLNLCEDQVSAALNVHVFHEDQPSSSPALQQTCHWPRPGSQEGRLELRAMFLYAFEGLQAC